MHPFQLTAPPVRLAFLLGVGLAPNVLLAGPFTQINLVSSVANNAVLTDPNLVNPWGMSFTATSPFWVSDQGSGVATLYTGTPAINALVVTIPGGSTPPSGPTGQVANGNASEFAGAHFIFDTLNGTIAAWSSGTTATAEATTPGAVYTGLAIGNNGSADYIYAANSAATSGSGINVFNTSFAATTLSGGFIDPNALAGFDPFNIQELNGDLYVTYAQLGAGGAAEPGGYIDEFDNNGNFLERVATGGALYAPWGITVAPAGFGTLGGDLLVGNFGNGEILIYDPSGNYLGTLNGTNGQPLVNQDLWALDFRTGGTGDNPEALYFTAGINNEQGGLFGEIVATTPEPSTLLTVGPALLLAGLFLRRRGTH